MNGGSTRAAGGTDEGAAIASAVLLVSTSAYTAGVVRLIANHLHLTVVESALEVRPMTLVCNGKTSIIRRDAKAPSGIVSRTLWRAINIR